MTIYLYPGCHTLLFCTLVGEELRNDHSRFASDHDSAMFHLLLFFTSAISQIFKPHDAVVDTGYARYLGNRSYSNTISYLGVPYAEPPLGELRFRKAVPLNTTRLQEEQKGIYDATHYPDFCIQGGRDGLAGGAGMEDCLKVNVYTPVGASRGTNLPVLVFLHGGGYIFGNPHNFPFDNWIHQSPNVVIVSVYYRLNSLGFLTHPEFTSSNIGDVNAGFFDQIEALRWIQKYIDQFGGNPEQVTIMGHSAGASSVELHLVARLEEMGRPNGALFSKAIAQSAYRVPLPTLEQQVPLFDFYSSAAGCEDGSVSEKMTCLRNVPVDALARAQDLAITPAFDGAYNIFRPVVDGKIIRDYPTKLIMNGEFLDVPLLIGATSNETSINEMPAAEGLKFLFPTLEEEDIQEFLRVYPRDDFTSDSQHFQVMTGESVFICSVPLIASAFSRRQNNVWTYRYNQPNPTKGSSAVAHSAESWMMFGGTNTGNNGTSIFTPLSPTDKLFSEELISYWLSFVRTGNPNSFKQARSPYWEKYTTEPLETHYQVPMTETDVLPRRRMVLQKDANGDDTASPISGCFLEREPENEGNRCTFVGTKVGKEQN
ncbi:hypothetical protein D9758_000817 [Tetrapyrgos nigripes]|uniref:Carboxylic ester hydrolase n=1 Tax=Tetrapyrgos nigripes TaxID=182062 RepID=A0A8H5LYA2_9AGAR|nr:hypothetical protein D9758_000817 [Tetrapyrgos nigripes]